MTKMNKKGVNELVSEVLGIVLGAVILVLILFPLAWGMYNLFTKPGVDEQAKATFEQIVAEISGLREGESSEYLVVNPEGWSLMSAGSILYMCDVKDFSFEELDKQENIIRACKEQNNLYHNFDFNLELIDSSTLGSCFHFQAGNKCVALDELPLNLVFIKEDGVVKITSPSQVKSDEMFEDFLDFKGSFSKSVRALVRDYAEDYDSSRFELYKITKEYFFGEEEEAAKITKILDEYFGQLDVEGDLRISVEDFDWKFTLSRYSSDFESYGDILLKSSDSKWILSTIPGTFSSNVYEFEVGGNKYKVTLDYYDVGDIDG